jgi:hypothetical protein
MRLVSREALRNKTSYNNKYHKNPIYSLLSIGALKGVLIPFYDGQNGKDMTTFSFMIITRIYKVEIRITCSITVLNCPLNKRVYPPYTLYQKLLCIYKSCTLVEKGSNQGY